MKTKPVMDPIKKTFTEAFNDFELPVREDLWESVLAKQSPKKKKPVPFLRIAAAIALFVVSGTVYWQLIHVPTEDIPALVSLGTTDTESTPLMPTEIEVPTPDTHPKKGDQSFVPVNHQVTLFPKKHRLIPTNKDCSSSASSEIPANPTQTAQIIPDLTALPEELVISQPEESPGVDFSDHEEEIIAQTQAVFIEEVAPQVLIPKRSPEQLLAKVKPALTDRSKTGPQRFWAALESLTPKVVDDLIAFGARNTEIEINW